VRQQCRVAGAQSLHPFPLDGKRTALAPDAAHRAAADHHRDLRRIAVHCSPALLSHCTFDLLFDGKNRTHARHSDIIVQGTVRALRHRYQLPAELSNLTVHVLHGSEAAHAATP